MPIYTREVRMGLENHVACHESLCLGRQACIDHIWQPSLILLLTKMSEICISPTIVVNYLLRKRQNLLDSGAGFQNKQKPPSTRGYN